MRISGSQESVTIDEFDLMGKHLPLDGADILELGCGAAQMARRIAEARRAARVVASEVDPIQHEKNLRVDDLPAVTFETYGAEAIGEPDASFDIVFMFKSLHHVPVASMEDALAEVHRVLRPGGMAWISEPVFAGSFNDVIRLFHDERAVRESAFSAVCRGVEVGLFELVEEIHFQSALRLNSFGEFEANVLGATHTRHDVDEALHEKIRSEFERHRGANGYAFEVPMRVDLLRRPTH